MSRALIVDDSRTAQARLKSLLKRYELEVDCSFSAEEALAYLSYKRPSVIFLDHRMEGMDGLEALRIIKANPATATIPVIMYTSEQGDVYMGQARALGALDIINKQVIKASNIERLLTGLKVKKKSDTKAPEKTIEEDITETSSEQDEPENDDTQPATTSVAETAPIQPETPKASTLDVQAQVARLFELHIADVRQQISDNSRFIVRNLRSEISKKSAPPPKPEPEKTADPEPIIELPVEEPKRFPIARYAFILSSALAISLFVLLMDANKEQEALLARYDKLLESNMRMEIALDAINNTLIDDIEPIVDAESMDLYDAVGWALNTSMHFEYGEEPLNEDQLNTLSELILRLDSAGFQGEIILDMQFGNFCVAQNPQGEHILANPSVMVGSDCRLLSDLDDQEFNTERFLNLSYINFEQDAGPLLRNNIRLQPMSSGLKIENERALYTAGEWNHRAAKDNQVLVRLIPDMPLNLAQ